VPHHEPAGRSLGGFFISRPGWMLARVREILFLSPRFSVATRSVHETGFTTTDENPGKVPRISDPHPGRSAELTTKPSPHRGGGEGWGDFPRRHRAHEETAMLFQGLKQRAREAQGIFRSRPYCCSSLTHRPLWSPCLCGEKVRFIPLRSDTAIAGVGCPYFRLRRRIQPEINS
jgi:hypothetical protein